jgi:Nitroreductase
MNVIDAISKRRSVRKFKNEPIEELLIYEIIEAASLAPSSKNRQPWFFYIISNDEKRKEMIAIFEKAITQREREGLKLPGVRGTINAMQNAPVTIFVTHPGQTNRFENKSNEEIITMLADMQSIGAAIQNICLAALEKGIGSLWIGDIYYAYHEFVNWLDMDGQLVAAISLGIADENPDGRQRKTIKEITKFV